ncbi:MAG: hypothetical protein AABY26_03070, partial [Nanoarchaeota archaeon]
MSIKERLTKIDPQLGEQRKKQAELHKEIEALKASLQEKEEEYSTQEQELAKKSDINIVLREELSEQVRLLEEREKNYRALKRESLLTEESISKDERIIDSYNGLAEIPDVQKDLKEHYDLAQLREVRRKRLEQPINLEILVGREQVSNTEKFVNRTNIIAPITVSQYRAFHQQDHEHTLVDNLLEWLMGNFLASKASPQQGEYNGFWKATILGTPELKFDSELPDEFNLANINVETVVLGEKELLLGGESRAESTSRIGGTAGEADEYTLPNGMKVNPSEKYTTSKVAEFLGYAGGSSILYVIGSAAERKKKGLPLLVGEVQYPEGDSTRRKKTLITGQNIIDFDQQLKSKRKDIVTVPPAKSVDDVVDEAAVPLSVPESGVEERASERIIIVPNQETFNVGEIAELLGLSYGSMGNLINAHPDSEQWKVKGQSRSGYVFGGIPRAAVEELAEKYRHIPKRKVFKLSAETNLVGLVEASRYIAGKLK